jgi:ParB family chromosome partitioning protein
MCIRDSIQPVTVSKMANGKYRLISGERRLRASKMAGLKEIPAYIRQANDAELLELALLENLQREDLNAVEVALSYKRMMEELDYTQEQVAERMGKDRSTVANFIRLLKLPPDIQLAVRTGKLSMGHARALINVDTIDQQLFIYKEIKSKELSVRQTEALVRTLYKDSGTVKKTSKNGLPPAYQRIEDKLASHFSSRVKLKHSRNGSGQITIDYYSLDEFNHILQKMNAAID